MLRLILLRLDKRIRIQLAVFAVISLIAVPVMFFVYMRAPATFFGVGRYTVTVQLPQAGGLYPGGNVTYRGVEVGRVDAVRLTNTGAEAVLQLKSDTVVPADVDAEVHSVSAVGEQYVALLPPHGGNARPLKNGDIIPANRTSIPPDINTLLAATNRGLTAIPGDNLKTVIDEGYTAVGGLGPELSRLLKGTTTLAIDARKNLDSLVTLADESKPLLDSQIESSDSIQAWAAHLATVTKELRNSDAAVDSLLHKGGPEADEVRHLLDRLQPTLPIVLANLLSVGAVALAYQPNLEQILVLFPQLVADVQGIMVGNENTKQAYAGAYLDFNLNLNIPPPCLTGYLPPQQQRSPSFEDRPPMPKGDTYCRIPQDAPNVVRGARNYPCATKPGKRAPTAQMCESDEEYVPLNDGFNWKGDPNATYTGQDVPQPRGAGGPPVLAAPPPGSAPPLASAPYDPASGTYIGPDGRPRTQANLGRGDKEKTWQQMLTPPMPK
jgi:phospholipid/cholesterol/gamma-HCH transport system substrate-binding protein